MSVAGEHSCPEERFVINQPVWGLVLIGGAAIAGVVAGVWMTIASGGRPDTPLVALGPMALLFGLGAGLLALGSRHGQIVVDDTTYTVRAGLRSTTKTLVFSDAAMVRGGVGDYVGYVKVTDHQGRHFRIELINSPAAMVQHIAARLLASSADIDPECTAALGRHADPNAPATPAVLAGSNLRLDSRGRLRWRRGTVLNASVAAFCIPIGFYVLFDAKPADTRWAGVLLLLVGLAAAYFVVHFRRIDKREFRSRPT